LVVHADAVLTVPFSAEPFQPIARRDPQILNVVRRMDELKLPQNGPLEVPINALDVLFAPDPLGRFAPERPDHASSV